MNLNFKPLFLRGKSDITVKYYIIYTQVPILYYNILLNSLEKNNTRSRTLTP